MADSGTPAVTFEVILMFSDIIVLRSVNYLTIFRALNNT